MHKDKPFSCIIRLYDDYRIEVISNNTPKGIGVWMQFVCNTCSKFISRKDLADAPKNDMRCPHCDTLFIESQ